MPDDVGTGDTPIGSAIELIVAAERPQRPRCVIKGRCARPLNLTLGCFAITEGEKLSIVDEIRN